MVVGGEEITDYGDKQLTTFRQNQVGFVFQSVNLVPFLNARENLLVVDELGRREGKPATLGGGDMLPRSVAVARRPRLGGGANDSTWMSGDIPQEPERSQPMLFSGAGAPSPIVTATKEGPRADYDTDEVLHVRNMFVMTE